MEDRMLVEMIRHAGDLIQVNGSFRLYNLSSDAPIIDRALEISRGFASIFTADAYLQNILGTILSPLFLFLVIIVIAWFVYSRAKKYNHNVKSDILQGQQLLLFKAKQIGLSDYQIKILKGITDILHLSQPSIITDDPILFERSISRFLSFATRMGENRESVESICKDLIITYEKIYHKADIRKPLSHLRELETNTLLTIISDDGYCFVGKIRSQTRDSFVVKIFAAQRESAILKPGLDIRVIFWRSGDADYEFSSIIISSDGSELELQIAHEFTRGQSVPHPPVDVMLPCSIHMRPAVITKESGGTTIQADIFKLNEFEAVIRCKTRLEHTQKCSIEFSIDDFAVRSEVQILRERYIADRKIYYFNLKFTDLSEAGRTIIGNFIISHLFA
jgi:hypothetical protein